MIHGRVSSPEPDEPQKPPAAEEVSTNSYTGEERARLLDEHAAHQAGVQESSGSTASGAGRRGARSRMWKIIAAVVVVVVLLAAAIAALFAFPIFTVKNVAVEGNQQLEDQQIVDATGIEPGENLMQVDTTAAARGVVGMPRVREATASRSFPSEITVTVVERRVIAWLEEGDEPTLIDDQAEAFHDGAPPESAVRLEGMDGSDTELLEGAIAIAGALSDPVGEAVEHISAESVNAYQLQLNDGRTVFWGRAVDNDNKALAVETVLQREGGEWDVSNPQMIVQR